MTIDSMDEIITETKLYLCVECGKCVSSCPRRDISAEFSYEFSSRHIIKKALLGFDILEMKEIWFCLTCDVCTKRCPSGVKYADFIEALRLMAVSQGIIEHAQFCQRCGQYYQSIPSLNHITGILEKDGLPSQFLSLCPKCRRYDCAQKLRSPVSSIQGKY